MRRIAFILCIVLLFLAVGVAGGVFYGWPRYFEKEISPSLMDASFVPGDFAEKDGDVKNPYRGWYRLYGYVLDDEGQGVSDLDAHIQDAGFELVQIEINLRNYAGGELSGAALSELSLILDAWETAGHQVILRFAYDFDGNATRYEPTDLEVVLGHISQVADAVNAHKKSIFTMQGLFVGECGEMHGTALCTDENYVALYQAMDAAIDPDVFLSVRTPSHFATVTGISQDTIRNSEMEDVSELFRGKEGDLQDAPKEDVLRLGLFNDGMLGSGNDLGTYEDRAEGIAFQEKLCLFVPNGGEAVLDNPFNDLDNALSDMAAMHVSYLNIDHDGAVITKWKNSYVTSKTGEDGFSYISSHLGYRFLVTEAAMEEWDKDARMVRLSFSVENKGFAPAYVPFSAKVQAVNEADGTLAGEISLEDFGCDVRDWRPGEVSEVTYSFDTAEWPEGDYGLYLSLQDMRLGRNIAFANSGDGDAVFLGKIQKTHREEDPWEYGRKLLQEKIGYLGE